MRKLYSLLIVWCVLLLAPGVYEAFGNVTLNGTLAAVWIVGYLAQFAVFMWIMNLVGEQKVLWWFITGVVLEVFKPWMNVVINNVYIRRRLRLRIQREDGSPAYEGILKGLFMLGEIPSVGDRLALRVDPVNPQHFDYDEASTATAQAASGAAADSGNAGLSDELARLAELRDRGALTDSEFAAAKKKLLR
jgi:hypothetical protein